MLFQDTSLVYVVGLKDFLTRPIKHLSKGYRQRVGIAQAILHKPDLLILDEPTSGLDPNQIVEIRELIRRLAHHSTVMLSTHILSEVELTCERVLIIMNGRLRADFRVADLRTSNAALVAIKSDAKKVEAHLTAIKGVDEVENVSSDGGYTRWRVASKHRSDLCPAIFEVVREHDWHIAELRLAPRTLEAVFHQLAENPEAEFDIAA